MEIRALLAVLISVLIIILYQHFFINQEKPGTQPASPDKEVQRQTEAANQYEPATDRGRDYQSKPGITDTIPTQVTEYHLLHDDGSTPFISYTQVFAVGLCPL